MRTLLLTTWFSAIFAALSCLPAVAQIETDSLGTKAAAPVERDVYLFQEGDTIADIAQRFLGSQTAKADILAFNALSSERDLRPGFPIVIPGEIRHAAQTAVGAAQNALKIAAADQAEQYAQAAYQSAKSLLDYAVDAKSIGNYERCIAIARKAVDASQIAISEAGVNAAQEQTIEIVSLSGEVTMTTDNGVNWGDASAGAKLPPLSRIRTGEDSRAKLKFPDGSAIELGPRTDLDITRASIDQRSRAYNLAVNLADGEISGDLAAPTGDGDGVIIEAGDATIVSSAAKVRASFDQNKVLRVSNLGGEVSVSKSGINVDLDPDHGVFAKVGSPLGKAVQIPPAPKVVSPSTDVFETASQTVQFLWDPRENRDDLHYLEIANDAEFIDVIDERVAPGRGMTSKVLKNGTYYWRMSTIDGLGLQGSEYASGAINVTTDLSILLTTDAEHKEINGRLVAGPGVAYTASPFVQNSSVVKIGFTVNGKRVEGDGNKIILTKSGDTHLVATGVGAAGEEGAPQAVRVYVDADAPEVRFHVSEPLEFPNQGMVHAVTILINDISGVREQTIRVGSQVYTDNTGPVLLPANETHNIDVEVTDSWGNQAVRSFRVKGVGNGPVISPAARIKSALEIESETAFENTIESTSSPKPSDLIDFSSKAEQVGETFGKVKPKQKKRGFRLFGLFSDEKATGSDFESVD